MNYKGNLFIVVKACVKLATLRWADNRKIGYHRFSEQDSSGFEFRVFPSPKLDVLQEPSLLYYLTRNWKLEKKTHMFSQEH